MPASEARIRANQANAMRSTGPKSPEGKARSRANATKHGLAGESAWVDEGSSAEFEERRAKWADGQEPVDEAAGWALDRAVAASLRIERCERAVDEVRDATRERARLAWDQDRAVEAATTFGRLATDPVLASRQLQATWAGVGLMIEAWLGLVAKLATGEDWSESEASTALDLLGVSAGLRSGRTLIDPDGDHESLAFRRELGLEEIERLEALGEQAMGPLDAMERRMMAEGEAALLSKPSRLLLRYERDAWRRYRESIRQARDPAPSPTVAPSPARVPSPVVAGRPEARERSVEPSARSLEGRVVPRGQGSIGRPAATGMDDEPAWLDDLERRVEALTVGRVAPGMARIDATERTR